MESKLRTQRQATKVSLLLTLALLLVASAAWSQTGTVSGTVLDSNGDPVPGVLVTLEDANGAEAGSASSGADGAFSISGVAAGTYTASTALDGFQDSSESVEVTAGARATVSFGIRPSYHEAVMVTAERIEESILEIPMTITAYDSSSMEELVLQDRTDLQNLVPGLQFGDDTQQDGQGTVIRGIGTRFAQYQHNDFAVATYVDGAYTLGTYGVAPGGGFDLERIEVARGPQGTLNGRNSIAGAINLVTKKPTNVWDAELMTEVTDVSRQRYNAAVGGPLGEYLSFRLTGGHYTGDGIQENVGPGPDYDAPDQTFWAPQLRLSTNRFDLNARYSRVEDEGVPRSFVQLTNIDTTNPFTVDGDPDPYYLWATPNPSINPNCPLDVPGWRCGDLENRVSLNFPGFSESESDFATLNANYQITDSLNVSYNFSDSDVASISVTDADHTNRVPISEDPGGLDHMFASDGGVPFDNVYYRLPFVYTERSHEMLFSSSFGGKFNFIGGLFTYENEREGSIDRFNLAEPFRFGSADEWARRASPAFGFVELTSCEQFLTDFLQDIFGVTLVDEESGFVWYCPEGNELTHAVNFFSRSRSDTEAAFFSGDFQVNDNWTISGGLRYTEDEKEQRLREQGGFAVFDCSFGFLNQPFGVPCGVTFIEGEGNELPQSWSRTIGHLSVEYATDAGNMVYGRVSTGFRAGGFNTGVPGTVPPTIDEETLINYELGTKGLFFDQRLQLSAGIWYNAFDGYQLSGLHELPPGSPFFAARLFTESPLVEFTSNIDDTNLYGLDVEFNFREGPWRLSGFYAYQDSEIGPHSSVILGNPNAEFGEWTFTEFGTGEEVTTLYELPTDQTGNRLPQQPEHKIALTGGYSRSLGDSGGFLQLISTYSYTDERFIDIGNLPIYELPSFDRWDVGVNWTSPSDRFSVALYVQNVLDEIGVNEFLPVAGNGAFPHWGT